MRAQGLQDRRSIRLPQYDYGQPGAYFITIVTEGRRELFGKIVDNEMRRSKLGQLAGAFARRPSS